MSKYTTEVRFICEVEAGLTKSVGFNDTDRVITTAAPKIFSFDFPIFDENYRLVLEKQILRHYYTREICMETVGAWKLKLQDRLNLIMPKYNKLYESAKLSFNPFYDVDLTTDHNRGNNGSSTSQATNTRTNNDNVDGSYSDSNSNSHSGSDSNTRWDLYSDTPQGGVTGINGATTPNLSDNSYLTNARKITDNGSDSATDTGSRSGTSESNRDQTVVDNGSSSGTVTNVENYLEHIKGKRGGLTYSKMLQEYRATFLNIDLMVINELSDLFFGLWE